MMGSFRRPRARFMSSPVLSDLARFHASSPALQISNTSVWNSVQSAVIKVFQGGLLQANELYTLNESIRWLLKTEMGSFITEYFQNQLLTRGLSEVLDQILLQHGDEQLRLLAEMWVRFFTETLPTLQAIFYPVQGQQLSVRQMALLSWRDLVLLKLHLEDALRTAVCIPPAVTQMLLVLQGVHDSIVPSMEYDQLEHLVEVVVSPYLGNSQLILESQHLRSLRALLDDQSSPEITVTQHHHSSDSAHQSSDSAHHSADSAHQSPGSTHHSSDATSLEGEAYLEKAWGVRRHTVANAHSDITLLSASHMMHAGIESGGGAPRPFLSQPDRLDSPRHRTGGEVSFLPSS